jgi:hypothetical protein
MEKDLAGNLIRILTPYAVILLGAVLVAACATQNKTQNSQSAIKASNVDQAPTVKPNLIHTGQGHADTPTTVLPGPACAPQQLTVQKKTRSEMANGGIDKYLVFTNHSGLCYLRGYPTVAGIDNSGRQLFHADSSTDGLLPIQSDTPAPPPVRLNPGGSASALWTYVRGEFAEGVTSQCPNSSSVRVGLPGTQGDVPWSKDSDSKTNTCDYNELIGPIISGTGNK